MPPNYDRLQFTGGFVRPGKVLTAVMVALFATWLLFALAVNWGDASEELFLLFCGNTDRILAGEVWRLFTAPIMHAPSGTIAHILMTELGLFFLAPTLEQRWGGARMLRFLIGSALIAYGTQVLVELVLPATLAAKLVGQYWFGFVPVIEAIAIAWAFSFKGQTVRLMFVLPVTSAGLIWFVVGFSLLRVVALSQTPEGLIAPFGGMLAGWLLGAGTPSPLRRAYLKFRLAQLDREAAEAGERRAKRAKQSNLRVIHGGRSDDDEPRGPDGQLLN